MSEVNEEKNSAIPTIETHDELAPLPWSMSTEHAGGGIRWCVEAEEGSRIVAVTTEANAEFIVRAVNAHDALVAACQSAAIAPYSSEATQVQLIAALRLAEGNVPERETETQ